ncbi:MAG TPA: carboxylating nicotinate-nucleotide diphosphorylase [Actinomycetota bacterium]|nr:carboxylating nicotinate-nucleotide diphosphorylase [Actinomycetota bacterium]
MRAQTAAAALEADVERVVRLALDEDTATRDITTESVVASDARGVAEVIASAPGVVFGLSAVAATFRRLDPAVDVVTPVSDADPVEAGQVLARLTGSLRAILTGERTALNLLGHLSGIATLTREFVRLAGTAEVTDTRKTLPGLRTLQKAAVRAGGGVNHRMDLSAAVLVKDNHIAACASVSEATRRAVSSGLAVQVECESAGDVRQALEAGASSLLLDNRPADELEALVRLAREMRPGVFIEASGGVTLETVAAIVATGVDRVSVGALTHSAPALDVSLRLVRAGS